MKLRDAMLPEFDHETANTRRVLERVADSTLGWRPHDKSWTMGTLASHIANLPTWMGYTVNQDSLDLTPGGKPMPRQPEAASNAELLARFDKNVADARAVLATVENETLMQPWSLVGHGKTYFTMPKGAVLRSFVMNHSVHHRAQLTIYLRLNNIPVPGMYGPSADETM